MKSWFILSTPDLVLYRGQHGPKLTGHLFLHKNLRSSQCATNGQIAMNRSVRDMASAGRRGFGTLCDLWPSMFCRWSCKFLSRLSSRWQRPWTDACRASNVALIWGLRWCGPLGHLLCNPFDASPLSSSFGLLRQTSEVVWGTGTLSSSFRLSVLFLLDLVLVFLCARSDAGNKCG